MEKEGSMGKGRESQLQFRQRRKKKDKKEGFLRRRRRKKKKGKKRKSWIKGGDLFYHVKWKKGGRRASKFRGKRAGESMPSPSRKKEGETIFTTRGKKKRSKYLISQGGGKSLLSLAKGGQTGEKRKLRKKKRKKGTKLSLGLYFEWRRGGNHFSYIEGRRISRRRSILLTSKGEEGKGEWETYSMWKKRKCSGKKRYHRF